mgnify:CR=1 FL=1
MAERKGNIGARENKALAQTKGEQTKMQNKAAFGSRIREYRIKKGLSQPQLAALPGVTKNAVTNWEAGASRPDIACIPALCTHLGIPGLRRTARGTPRRPRIWSGIACSTGTGSVRWTRSWMR